MATGTYEEANDRGTTPTQRGKSRGGSYRPAAANLNSAALFDIVERLGVVDMVIDRLRHRLHLTRTCTSWWPEGWDAEANFIPLPPPSAEEWRPCCGAPCANWRRTSRIEWWTGPRAGSRRGGRGIQHRCRSSTRPSPPATPSPAFPDPLSGRAATRGGTQLCPRRHPLAFHSSSALSRARKRPCGKHELPSCRMPPVCPPAGTFVPPLRRAILIRGRGLPSKVRIPRSASPNGWRTTSDTVRATRGAARLPTRTLRVGARGVGPSP
jgi:hypothetical protein